MSEPVSPGSTRPTQSTENNTAPNMSNPSPFPSNVLSRSPASPTFPHDPTPSTPTRHEADGEEVTSETTPRRRAHTVAVSLRPRSGSDASVKHAPLRGIRTSFASSRDGKAVPDDEEANLASNGDDQAVRRKRASSIVDRFRDSIGGRERSGSAASGAVGYEMMHHGRRSGESRREDEEDRELNDEVVGMLDVIDPEVSTVNHLQNVTNGIFLPHFPALWSRRPEIKLGGDDGDDNRRPSQPTDGDDTSEDHAVKPRKRSSTVAGLYPSAATTTDSHTYPQRSSVRRQESTPLPSRQSSTGNAPSVYPPKTVELQPTSPRESFASDHSLDAHVRTVVHLTKRQKVKKGMKGLWIFLKTPMGFATGIYGILVVFWGAAIVFFLAGWIPTSDKWWQDRWVEISSQIVNGLFTITGVGLIPWRVQDTYRMSIIWTLRQRLHRKRKQQGLPPVEDPNDIEDPKDQEEYVSVLSEKERAQLKYQQEMFAKSQTWYRPHATATHRAFPMSWALWNTILMDLNSAFQCILCGCMWGLSQYKRPAWTTGSLIPLSFLCGIGAGILIWQGSARTKKSLSVNEKLRQALFVPLAIGAPTDSTDKIVNTLKPKIVKAIPTSAGPPAISTSGIREKPTIVEEREEEMGASTLSVAGNGERRSG